MTSWQHAPLKVQHTCSRRWSEMVLQCDFNTRDTSVTGSDPYTRYYVLSDDHILFPADKEDSRICIKTPQCIYCFDHMGQTSLVS